MKTKIENIGFLKGVILLFLLGFLMGLGIFLGLQEHFTEHAKVFYDNLIQNLTMHEMEYGQLLRKVILKEFRSFFLMALFGISILGIPYIFCFLIGNGFLGGFFLGSMMVSFGTKGMLLGILLGFPQMLLYVPVMTAMIHKNYYMGVSGLKKKQFLEQIPSMIILLGILLVGCFLEAYVNTWIIKKVLLWIN